MDKRDSGADYFDAIGVWFAAGRAFDEPRKDRVVVNEAFVRRHLRGSPEVVGAMLGTEKNPLLIAGLVRDVRHLGLRKLRSQSHLVQIVLLKGHTLTVTAICVSADAHRVVSGSFDGTLKIWNLGRDHPQRDQHPAIP